MRIHIITSCTGEKSVDHEQRLGEDDFEHPDGARHIRARHRQLVDALCPAEELYCGQQHRRLMRGVRKLRQAMPSLALDLHILSAGYGLVDGGQRLAPYNVTFQGQGKRKIRQRAEALAIPRAIRRVLATPNDLTLLLLGQDYLTACALDPSVTLAGPTIALCSAATAKDKKGLAGINGITVIALGQAEAKRFRCAQVGLKGELGARMLEQVADLPERLHYFAASEPWELLDLLDPNVGSEPLNGRRRRVNPKVYQTIHLRRSWRESSRRRPLSYFIPEWDDMVDPNFDFLADQHWGGTGGWSNQAYAHQMLADPAYDGILISRSVAEEGHRKKARVNQLGVHRYLRLPRSFPIMGDCGAFNYRDEVRPPYTTDELIDFYTRLDVDFGVSIDHLIITDDEEQRRFRYELTLNNAENFLREHQALDLPWTPIGAIQGWDAESYAQAARQCVSMGYRYLGLGGLVRTRTRQLLPLLQAIRDVVPSDVDLHLFGVGRLEILEHLKRLNIRSFDSASYLRQAWMRTTTSYVLPQASYAALRIPETTPAFCRRTMSAHPELREPDIQSLEKNALEAVRRYAAKDLNLEKSLSALLAYDKCVTAERIDMSELYRRTLADRPWERCHCEICRNAGVEVIIFRGNNRNRRRGFHNTYVFYDLLNRTLKHRTV